MMRVLIQQLEKVLFAAAVLLLAGTGLFWISAACDALSRVQDEPGQVVLTGPDLAEEVFARPRKHSVWERPSAQSQGEGWIYEVFTPPVIYYHPAARSFAVTPPHYVVGSDDAPFGWELLAVQRAPYRLQLAGYFGRPGDYLAAFVSADLSHTLLARPGQRFEKLDLSLRRFDVRKVSVPTDGVAGMVYDVVAFATLHDARTGSEVVLDSRSPLLTDTLLAVFQIPGGKGRPQELFEGDSLRDEAANYRIERIHLDPPEVVMTRTVPGVPLPEMRIMRPVEDGAGHMVRESRIAPTAGAIAQRDTVRNVP